MECLITKKNISEEYEPKYCSHTRSSCHNCNLMAQKLEAEKILDEKLNKIYADYRKAVLEARIAYCNRVKEITEGKI